MASENQRALRLDSAFVVDLSQRGHRRRPADLRLQRGSPGDFSREPGTYRRVVDTQDGDLHRGRYCLLRTSAVSGLREVRAGPVQPGGKTRGAAASQGLERWPVQSGAFRPRQINKTTQRALTTQRIIGQRFPPVVRGNDRSSNTISMHPMVHSIPPEKHNEPRQTECTCHSNLC
jgi:hypothetical protein